MCSPLVFLQASLADWWGHQRWRAMANQTSPCVVRKPAAADWTSFAAKRSSSPLVRNRTALRRPRLPVVGAGQLQDNIIWHNVSWPCQIVPCVPQHVSCHTFLLCATRLFYCCCHAEDLRSLFEQRLPNGLPCISECHVTFPAQLDKLGSGGNGVVEKCHIQGRPIAVKTPKVRTCAAARRDTLMPCSPCRPMHAGPGVEP